MHVKFGTRKYNNEIEKTIVYVTAKTLGIF